MEDSSIGYHPSNKGLRSNKAIGERATRLTQYIEIFRARRSSPETSIELKDFLTQVLTRIFKRSRDKMKLPEDWKLAHFASIFKKGKNI